MAPERGRGWVAPQVADGRGHLPDIRWPRASVQRLSENADARCRSVGTRRCLADFSKPLSHEPTCRFLPPNDSNSPCLPGNMMRLLVRFQTKALDTVFRQHNTSGIQHIPHLRNNTTCTRTCMPRLKRSSICAASEIQVFHLTNRCVRRTFLCGIDKTTGKDYSHRKGWIRQRLEELAGIFGLDILGFAVLSNHLHVVVRTRPDIVLAWSDSDVVCRWWQLFPLRRTENRLPAEITPDEVSALCCDTTGLQRKRERLSSISWFMRCLAEPIARRGNRDDDVTGRFWEGRFRAQILLDETAITACLAYVDLNPIRAGAATSLADSEFTSVRERISDLVASQSATTPTHQEELMAHGARAGWLSPLSLKPGNVSSEKITTRRASNRGCIPMSLTQYLDLLEWTGRQMRGDKAGRIPAESASILELLECSEDTWLRYVQRFRKVFKSAAGLLRNTRAHKCLRQQRNTQPAAS